MLTCRLLAKKTPSSLIRPSYTIRAAIFEKSVKKDGNKIFKVPYQLLGLKLLLLNAGRQANTGLTPGWNIIFNYKTAPSGIQTWDLSICLYLNLKHGDLYCSATTAGLQYWLITCRRNWLEFDASYGNVNQHLLRILSQSLYWNVC